MSESINQSKKQLFVGNVQSRQGGFRPKTEYLTQAATAVMNSYKSNSAAFVDHTMLNDLVY